MYFDSYSLQISGPSGSNPNFTAFTSTLPYYYVATDDNIYSTYAPAGSVPPNSTNLASPTNPLVFPSQSTLPYFQVQINLTFQLTYIVYHVYI